MSMWSSDSCSNTVWGNVDSLLTLFVTRFVTTARLSLPFANW